MSTVLHPASRSLSRKGSRIFPQTDDMLRKRKKKKPRKNLNILFLSLSFLGLSRFPVRNRIYARDERTCRYRHRRRAAERILLSPRAPPERRIRLGAFGGGAGTRCSSGFWYWILDRRRRTGPRLKWKQMKLDVMRSCGEGEPVL